MNMVHQIKAGGWPYATSITNVIRRALAHGVLDPRLIEPSLWSLRYIAFVMEPSL